MGHREPRAACNDRIYAGTVGDAACVVQIIIPLRSFGEYHSGWQSKTILSLFGILIFGKVFALNSSILGHRRFIT